MTIQSNIGKKQRQKDAKGNKLYKGDVLYDTSNKKFYYVLEPFSGVLVTIEENTEELLLEDLKDSYLKRWIF